MGQLINVPWVLIGDVNQPLERADKMGGKSINPTFASKLRHVVDTCKSINLGYHGAKYTWTNGRQGRATIRETLDRAWVNFRWLQGHPIAVVHHLLRASSNHHPFLLESNLRPMNARYTGFRFLEAWFLHLEFTHTVEQFWTKESRQLLEVMNSFKYIFGI